MNKLELDRALHKLRMSGIAETLEARVIHVQAESRARLDFLSILVNDELVRRHDRLIERRIKRACFRDLETSLDNSDFNRKFDRKLVLELAADTSITRCEDALLLGPNRN